MRFAACCGLLLGCLHGLVSLELRPNSVFEAPGSALVGAWSPAPPAGAGF